jgi:hypothetical protein
MPTEKERDQIDLSWENRVLCSDEACIGTIGPDGRCRECGLPYEGALPEAFGRTVENAGDGVDSPQDDADPSPPSADESVGASRGTDDDADAPLEDDEWARRTLCRDEACIGTIGPDGRCKECGLPYEE